MKKAAIEWNSGSLTVIGKGNKERIVYFSFKASYHLKKYLNERNDNCEALFITERKEYRRLSNRGIEREFIILGNKINLKLRT